MLQEDKTPRVSVIIATYNSEKTIRVALDSVLNQQYQDWECIVVDGLSKDGTVAIVKEFCEKDSRFRCVSEKDNGIYDAFNKGWKMAKGEWIHYLGSDDYLTDEGFSKLMETEHPNVAIVSGHCYCIKLDGSVKENYSVDYYGCHQGKLTRRSVIEKCGGFDESFKILADMDLIFKIRSLNLGVDVVDSFVANFAMDGASQRLSNVLKISKERYRIFKNYPQIEKHPFFKNCYITLRVLLSILYRSFGNFMK